MCSTGRPFGVNGSACGSCWRNGIAVPAGPLDSSDCTMIANDASPDRNSCGWMFLKSPRSPSETLGVSSPLARFVSCSEIVAAARLPPSGFRTSLESVTSAVACEAVNATSNSDCGAVVDHSVCVTLPLPSGSWSCAVIVAPMSALPPTWTFVNPRFTSKGVVVKFAAAPTVVVSSGFDAASR